MTRKWFSLVLAVQLLALCVVQVALAQDDMKDIKDPAFVVHRRAPAAFAHDAHNEKAKIEDCVVCHHGGKDGVIDKIVGLIEQDAGEAHQPMTLIMVHAQDHLMNSLLAREFSEELIHLYQR